MKLAPAVIVHGLGMARAAVLPGRPVLLLSAEAAGIYAGVGWWRALVAQVRASSPHPCAVEAQIDDMLDCGAAPGRALEALRAGQAKIVLRAEPRIWNDIAERAASCGGILFAAPPPALDLAQRGAGYRLQAWLSQDAG